MLGLVAGYHPGQVGKDGSHVVDHLAVVRAGRLLLISLHRGDIFPLFLPGLQLRWVKLVRSRTRWTKVCMEAFPAPGCLDEQHGAIDELLDRQAECELWPNLGACIFSPEAHGQRPGSYTLTRSKRRDPDAVAHTRHAVLILHQREQGDGLWIHREVREGADLSVTLHVGLPSKHIHLERLYVVRRRSSGRPREHAHESEPHHDRFSRGSRSKRDRPIRQEFHSQPPTVQTACMANPDVDHEWIIESGASGG